MTHSSPSRTAVVAMEPESDPERGSVMAMNANLLRKRSICSGVGTALMAKSSSPLAGMDSIRPGCFVKESLMILNQGKGRNIMPEKQDIQFESNGLTCRGWLFRPSQEGKTPCIVLAHGFCGVKEMRLDAYAKRFAEAGYCALVFDYRHFGSSDGEPRQILDIELQHQDWNAAIKYARSLPHVDPEKIILWGTSFSGGHVLAVAVEDKRIASVISQVPHMDGSSSAMAAGIMQNLRLGFASIRDNLNKFLNGRPFYVPALGRPGDLAAMVAPGEYERSRKLFPKNGHFNEYVAARVFLSLSRYSPGKLAPELKIPWLVQVATGDLTTPPKPAMKAAQKAPKGELITYDLGHFEVYVQPDFERTISDQLAFLKRHIS